MQMFCIGALLWLGKEGVSVHQDVHPHDVGAFEAEQVVVVEAVGPKKAQRAL